MKHKHFELGNHACQCDNSDEPNTVTDPSKITVTHHEGAVICSAERVIAKEYERVRDTLVIELKTLADWVEDQGGIVGHIKAYIADCGNSSMLSTVGGDVQVKETLTQRVTVKVAVIVFIKNETLLYTKIVESLERLGNI